MPHSIYFGSQEWIIDGQWVQNWLNFQIQPKSAHKDMNSLPRMISWQPSTNQKGHFSFKIGNLEHRGRYQVVVEKEILRLHYNGRSCEFSLSATNLSDEKQIIAPMPGKITTILIDLNQEVTEGQSLLVMEAMKMETTIKSGKKSLIKKINIAVGQTVSAGQVLLELQAE